MKNKEKIMLIGSALKSAGIYSVIGGIGVAACGTAIGTTLGSFIAIGAVAGIIIGIIIRMLKTQIKEKETLANLVATKKLKDMVCYLCCMAASMKINGTSYCSICGNKMIQALEHSDLILTVEKFDINDIFKKGNIFSSYPRPADEKN